MDPQVLVREHEALVKGMVKRYLRNHAEYEDLYQEGMMGLLLANRRFNAQKGAEFSTYAHYWIRKRILQAIGENISEQHSSLDFAQLERLEDKSCAKPETICRELELPAEMPALESKILQLCYGETLTIKEVSQRLGISAERVRQLRTKALRRLKIAVRAAEVA